MRTTVTLGSDVEALLRKARHDRTADSGEELLDEALVAPKQRSLAQPSVQHLATAARVARSGW